MSKTFERSINISPLAKPLLSKPFLQFVGAFFYDKSLFLIKLFRNIREFGAKKYFTRPGTASSISDSAS